MGSSKWGSVYDEEAPPEPTPEEERLAELGLDLDAADGYIRAIERKLFPAIRKVIAIWANPDLSGEAYTEALADAVDELDTEFTAFDVDRAG